MDNWLDEAGSAWKYRDIVISRSNIVELAKGYGLVLEDRSGQFSHRTTCPFHQRKGGGAEKTPSFFLCQQTNSFCCFGCGRGGNPIDFVSLVEGIPPLNALKKLAIKLEILNKNGEWDELIAGALLNSTPIFDATKTIEPHVMEISILLRDHIQKFVNCDDFNKEFKWFERMAAKVDDLLLKIGQEDWEYVKDMRNVVARQIQKRKVKCD